MADNFNLRSFLTENKLTKNAQLLKEQEEGYRYFEEEGNGGFYLGTADGHKVYSMEDSSIMDTCFYAIEDPEGYVEFVGIDVAGEPVSSEDLQNEYELLSYVADLIEADIAKELGQEGEEQEMEEAAPSSMQAGFDMVNASHEQGIQIRRIANEMFPEFGGKLKDLGAPLTPEQRNAVWDAYSDYKTQKDNKDRAEYQATNPPKKRETTYWDREMERESVDNKKPIMKEASYKVSKNSKQAQQLKKGDIITSGDEVVSISAGAKTPAGKVEVTLKTKSGSTKTSTWGKTTMIGVKPKEDMKETKLTAKERRLVEMVNKALKEGYDTDRAEKVVGSDGVTRYIAPDESPAIDRMYDSDEYGDALANAGTNEGDESIEEAKPLPKYNSIEELMKEIEHGTNEAAHKYKMDEMKRVYEALEAKVGSLEEGENAEHIDQKKVKQMRKDIAALRKAEERLRKDFDKKFSKEKKEAPKKEKEVVALQEGNFDLRKFLTENKLTAGSRMVQEGDFENTPVLSVKTEIVLMDFVEEDSPEVIAYEKLGFKVEVNDVANREMFAELELTGTDWMGILAVLEDCERANVAPFMEFNGKNIPFEQALRIADEKASEDSYDDAGIGASINRKTNYIRR